MSSRLVQRASARQLESFVVRSSRRLNGSTAFTSAWLPRQHSVAARVVPAFEQLHTARCFSDKGTTEEKVEETEETATENEATPAEEEETPEAEPEMSREEELEQQVKDLKDQLLRGLAEQENTRNIAKRDVASARNFAVTSFAKSLLDTSDNLSRALEHVPEEEREKNDVLANLYEGIQMTEAGLLKAFEKNGLVRFGEVGDEFDPNKYEALFEYPDPDKAGGSVGQVMKKGFTLNDRVIRPAEVGVVKKD